MASDKIDSKMIEHAATAIPTYTEELFTPLPEEDIEPHHGSQKSLDENEGCFTHCYVQKRYIMTFLTAVGMLLTFAMRTNVGMTVVMILDERAHEKVGSTKDIHELNIPRLNWDSTMIGFLHSIFYIGYFITQIPGAWLTTIWPSHKLYGMCILLSSLLNLLMPISIQMAGYPITCTLRCFQGVAEGLLYPACYGVLRHWSTPANRNRQVSSVLTCAYAGVILGFPVAGLATHYLGWKYIYYLSGGACIVWYLFWVCFSHEKPSHHTSISDQEYEYFENEQGHDVIDYENIDTPWRSILTSLPVLAICFCHFAWHWVFILMLTNEPLYLNQFGFSIAETGLYASLPHVSKVIVSLASGVIADVLMKTSLSMTVVRKILTEIGLSVQSVCFIVLTQLYHGTAVIIVLTTALGFFGLSTSGWQVNHYDLSTRHASTLVAVTSTFGATGAILVPIAVGGFTSEQDLQGWRNVFYVTTAIVALALTLFLTLGSGKQQPWAIPPPHLELVQKTDPLARKPYKLFALRELNSSASTSKTNSNDNGKLLEEAFDGQNYGTNAQELEADLSKKLS